MKIKTKHVSPEFALSIKKPAHRRSKKPNIFFRTLIRALSVPSLLSTRFKYESEDMEKAGGSIFCECVENLAACIEKTILHLP